MLRVTMDIVTETMFSADVGGQYEKLNDALRVVQDMAIREMTALIMPVPDWVPTPRNLRENQAMDDLDAVVMSFIQEWRKHGEDKGDLLSMLMLAEDEDTGEHMTDEQVREEVITLFTAGYDTTALALTWTFYLLSLHRDAEERLLAEVRGVLNGRAPTLDDLQAMHYTDWVLKEAMRLYPPAPFYPREAIEATELGGYPIPKNAMIFISPYVLHRDPRWFPDPERFDPERFAPEREGQLPKYGYFPFGGGPRVCLGQAFALMEAEIILATLIQRYHLALVPGQEIIPEPTITMHARHGIKLKVEARA
jgi:cytochrome P450